MNERISKLIHHPLTIPVTVGIVSFGTGMASGYILARKTGKKAELYEVPPHVGLDLTEQEIEELEEEARLQLQRIEQELHEKAEDRVPQVLRDLRDDPDASDETRAQAERLIQQHLDTPISKVVSEENAPEELSPVVEVDGEYFEGDGDDRIKVIGDPPEVTPVRRNAFAVDDDDWNYESEVRNRTEVMPYILHKDEFYADEKEYSQITLTYYAGDNILVDEDDTPVYNHERVVGPMRFGHGSADPNVFYVRNDVRKAEYEILRDSGLYSVEVLGLEIENNQRVRDLRHSHEPSKFRAE